MIKTTLVIAGGVAVGTIGFFVSLPAGVAIGLSMAARVVFTTTVTLASSKVGAECGNYLSSWFSKSTQKELDDLKRPKTSAGE